MIDIPVIQYFTHVNFSHDARGHCYKLACNYLRVNVRKYIFSQPVVRQWNKLPALPQDFKNLTTFKDILWQTDLNKLLLL
jgi:hypothetical protein